ncbi:MAG: DUF488 domain-containing protein [Gemmatimonadetes bacterium]|nr:DUF488 domain-containing protein [Gemmatimonadota bacterium]
MHTVFTIGHSTRPADELVGLLQGNGVRVLVDVRRFPGSRRHPQYNREELARTLEGAGIGYRHEEDLGGRREGARVDSPNGGWRNASFRAYADHLGTPAFAEAVARLLADAARGPVAIMCAEAVPWRCHRQLIADALVAGGAEVRHILSGAEPALHELNAMAVVDDGGAVTYPAEAPEQPDLFGGEPAADGS